MNATPDDIRERVERGAAVLDAHAPGWYRLVPPEDLDMSNPCKCVEGHRVGDYHDSDLLAPTRELLGPRAAQRLAASFGLTIWPPPAYPGDGDDEFVQLTEAWRDLIWRRLAEDESVPC
jgi:hypothetical protein